MDEGVYDCPFNGADGRDIGGHAFVEKVELGLAMPADYPRAMCGAVRPRLPGTGGGDMSRATGYWGLRARAANCDLLSRYRTELDADQKRRLRIGFVRLECVIRMKHDSSVNVPDRRLRTLEEEKPNSGQSVLSGRVRCYATMEAGFKC